MMAMEDREADVLVVDDDRDFLGLLRLLLEEKGFSVQTASSAQEALEKIESKLPDAVVCDYVMPSKDGIWLLKRLRASRSVVPFIMLTGRGDGAAVMEAINNGADYYIQKGDSGNGMATELEHKLRQAIKHAEDEEELRLTQFSLDNASLAVIWFDDEGGIARANRAACDLIGCEEQEMLSRNVLDIDMSMSLERWLENLDLCRRAGRLRYEASLLRSDGEVLPAEVEINLFERRGRPCVVSFLRDVHDRKLADEYSGEKLAILEGLQQVVIEYVDADLRLRWTNRPGVDRETMLDEDLDGHCYSVLRGRSEPCQDCPALRALRTGRPERGAVQAGEGLTVMLTSTPVRDRHGHVVGVVSSSLDVSTVESESHSLEDAMEAMQASVDGIALLRQDETYWYMNQAHARIYGYDSAEELLGRTWHILYGAEELQRFRNDVMPRLGGAGSWRGEAVGMRKDGSFFEQEVSLTALEDGGLVCVVRDISERKRMERELESNRHLLTSIIDSSPDFIYIYDLKLRRNLFSNYNLAKFLGYSPEETKALGDGLFDRILHPDDVERVHAYQAELADQPDGAIMEAEYRMRRSDGTWRWLHSRDMIFSRDPDGSARSEIGSAEDVTERKLVQAELARSEERFRNLVELADAGIWAMGTDRRITYANRKAHEMLGYAEEDMVGTPVSDLFPAGQAPPAFLGTHGRGDGAGRDVMLATCGGGLAPARIAAAPVFDDSGRRAGTMAVVVDTGDIVAKEEALRKMNERLGILSSITRHDILNQVTVLGGYLEMERLGVSPERRAERLEKMSGALRSIEKHITFTMDYEETGVRAAAWQDVRTVVRAAAGSLDTAGIDLVVDVHGLQILADPLLVKVFYNLIDNSIRHGGGVGRIAVTFNATEGAATLIYEDDGAGIPEEDRACLFSRGCEGGGGLGLFLSKEILSITGITIAEAGSGRGARFLLGLPAGTWRPA
jgi:PAS domain S-box-containing protein